MAQLTQLLKNKTVGRLNCFSNHSSPHAHLHTFRRQSRCYAFEYNVE